MTEYLTSYMVLDDVQAKLCNKIYTVC